VRRRGYQWKETHHPHYAQVVKRKGEEGRNLRMEGVIFKY
jgi:hypothetical protein